MKIRTKLILANLFIVLFLLGSLTFAMLQRSSKIVYDYVIENAALSVSQTSQNLDNKLESYEEIANTLFLNTNINLILDQRYADQLEAYEVYAQQFQPFITTVRQTKDIYYVSVYTDNPTFTFANVTLIDKDVQESDWYRTLMKNTTGGYWTEPYISNPTDADPVIAIRKRLNNVDRNSPSVVSLEIKLKKLSALIEQESKTKRYLFAMNDGTVLIDEGGETKKLASLADLPFGKQILDGTKGSFAADYDGRSYRVVYQTLDSRNIVDGMKVVAFIPVDQLLLKIDNLRSISYALFGAAFLLSAVLIGTLSVGMTRKLSELSYRMKRADKDNFQTFIEVKGNDEVAQLGRMFNFMIKRVGQLISEVYQSQIDRKEQALRTKEVELYALQTQINPHFLFNVLNMIRGKLLISGDRENAKVVGLLAKSFRMMLKKGGRTIPLAEELEFVGTYLQIQQYRFGDKLSFDIDVPREMNAMPIPKLSIQPLVENTVSHGIELDASPSHIRIYGEILEGRQRIVVSDDGLGMTAERLDEVRRWLIDDDSLSQEEHIGLRNVHRRLRQQYGPECGLEIDSEEGRGTRVTIWLPDSSARRAEEE
ncbi:sensor histidine kinase [Cohnella sp. GCM10027633]|uniref:sensor histidine kinase n=1 Tax=unclassified Cohnella TaxID=2636738 RepID=UPI0036423088